MVSHEYARGDKSIGLIVGNKYVAWNSFIGQNFGIPLKKFDGEIASKLLGISTMELADGKKLPKRQLVAHCEEILEACDTMGIDKLLVVSADYFKYLSGCKGFEDEISNVFSCNIGGYEHIKICPCINPAVISAQPNKKQLLTKSIDTFGQLISGKFTPKKDFEFESYELVVDEDRLRVVLEMLSTKSVLTADIETTSLRLGEAEILTIAFAWDEYNAITIPCHDHWCLSMNTDTTISMLKDFFRDYQGKFVFHNNLFDQKHIIYNWFMDDFSDTKGLYDGIEALHVDTSQDTMLLAYCELNSTERPPLGLKVLAKDFMGNYAEDVKDCKAVPLDKLAIYNAKDCCATFYVYNMFKHQETSRGYTEILQPSLEFSLTMMLNGLPIDMPRVDKLSDIIGSELGKAEAIIANSNYVRDSEENLRYLAMVKYNVTHVGNKEAWEFDIEFNPNSSTQLRVLLFDVMSFTPLGFTEGGSPKTDRASILEFIGQCQEDDLRLETLNALKTISETAIIQKTFLSAFKELSIIGKDGNHTLHGDLRLGGTQSGRMSSSSPNMQNIPSGSIWGKAIKDCFVAPEGWLFVYADFNALEDKIGAILSKDKNKTAEFLEGFDGHSLRCNSFFPEELAELGLVLDPTDPSSINRIQTEAKELRNKSKPISFLKQYGGGASKIQTVLKCSQQRAVEISEAYDKLYSGLASFQQSNELFAKKEGYVELAFGLKLLTPKINSKDSGVQSAEVRSASNAVTQSWGQLMNRAAIDMGNRIKTDKYTNSVKPILVVHDCYYALVKDDATTLKWFNDNLIDAMEWQDDPLLSSKIRIGAEVDIGRDWAHPITIPNRASLAELEEILAGL